jgi:hypothetical protein
MGALTRLPQAPWVAGIVVGVLAVLAGTIGGANPPEAYGFCTTCRGRDLVLGIVQPWLPGTFDLPTLWPLLTVIGVIVGAWLARRAAHERPSLERIDRRLMAIRIIQGFVVMSLALLAMGCPIRLTVSAASLAVQGFVGLAGVALGIWIGVQYLKARA